MHDSIGIVLTIRVGVTGVPPDIFGKTGDLGDKKAANLPCIGVQNLRIT